MNRITFWFVNSENYVSVEADEFHEDGEFVKAYNGSELVAMFRIDCIKGAYTTRERIKK